MKRSWITGLTMAGVAGTGGAAFAGMSVINHDGSPVEAFGGTAASASTTTYQLGTAGTVTITSGRGIISVDSTSPATGWSFMAATTPSTHVAVTLTDTVQIITFTADPVDGRVVVALTNAASGNVSAPAPAGGSGLAPAPRAATPVIMLTPSPRQPAPGATSAASGSTTKAGQPTSGGHEQEREKEQGDD